MSDSRRQALEARLQALLGEITEVCSELGINTGTSQSAATQPSTGPEGSGPLLLARLESHLLGFVAREVLELARMVAISDPLEPSPSLQGFVNVRGQAVPVINLRHLLGVPSMAPDPDQALVFLKRGEERVAVVVDEVLDIYELGPENFRDRSALSLRRGFIDGVARVEEELVAVINPELLSRAAL